MFATALSALCSGLAVWLALRHIRAVSMTTTHDPALLSRTLAKLAWPEISRLREGLASEEPSWEADLVGDLAAAESEAEVRGAVNAALLDVEARFAWGSDVPATSTRICLVGSLMAVALLIVSGAIVSWELLDVVALGGAGVSISLLAGAEARRLERTKRAAIDDLVAQMVEIRGLGG